MKKSFLSIVLCFCSIILLAQTENAQTTLTFNVDGRMLEIANKTAINKEQLVGKKVELLNYQKGAKCFVVVKPNVAEAVLYSISKSELTDVIKNRISNTQPGDQLLFVFENNPDGTQNYSLTAHIE